jgi:hypothetical protein
MRVDVRGGAHARASGRRIVNQRHIGAPRLLRRLVRDAAPALDALLRGLRQMLLSPRAITGAMAATPSFGGFLDGPLHAIELVDGETSVTGSAGSA